MQIGSGIGLWGSGGRRAPLDGYLASLFAVFSFRRLVSSYRGPCLRVRRASDNGLKDIGFAGDWLDLSGPEGLLTHVGAATGFEVTWYDQSGNGRHIIQNTAAAQRRLVNAGVLESFGGQPALYGASSQYYTSTWPALPQPATIIATLKLPDYTVGADQNLLRTNALTAGFNGVPYVRHPDGKAALYAGSVLPGGTLVDGTAYALSWVMAGAASLVGANGVYAAGDAGTEALNASPNVFAGLGGGAPIIGQAGDLLLFTEALTQAQLTGITRALGEPRGIVIP